MLRVVLLSALAQTAFVACDDASDPAASETVWAGVHDLQTCGDTRLAPSPVELDIGTAVPIDVEHLEATVLLDVAARRGSGRSRLVFRMGPHGGLPVFDQRQVQTGMWLDGEPLDLALVTRHELAREDTGGVLVLGRELAPCSRHELVVDHELDSQIHEAPPRLPHWQIGVVWTSGFKDITPGALLERWFPVGLIHDTFSFELEVDVAGGDEHVFLANAPVVEVDADNHWRAAWPVADAMAPLWYVSRSAHMVPWPDPSGRVALHHAVEFWPGTPDAWLALAHATLDELTARFGPRAGDGSPLLIIVDGFALSGGMEHPNAVIIGFPFDDMIRHELAHLWFGRTIQPARHIDAWWDEGLASLLTRPDGDFVPLDPSEPDAAPLAPTDPWARATPVAAYTIGTRVFVTLVEHLGRAVVDETLRELIARCGGAHLTHHDLRAVFAPLGDRAFIEALFDRWVITPGDEVVRGTCAELYHYIGDLEAGVAGSQGSQGSSAGP